VYATDISATKGAADGVVIPADVNVIAKYPIAALSTSTNSTAAQAWIAFVTGTEGQTILKNYGFGAP
jgi:molybdate transport system substrate-binding protein